MTRTFTPNLLDALTERIGKQAATQAINLFAAWADGAANELDIVAGECPCPEDHAADAEHFRHLSLVMVNVYDADPSAA
ncbi:hypothetical protein GCM10027187_40570 [Streptosporangium sandarakinum]|uniref:Uncharacterized protein n=1 Tax=Streptosporangium sandarakinum TaxID=1260955 RepID=A0A852VBK2_9ACTN|nr:hypothetical protein [Streptosporangium sandarakinum]NYF44613.1 hypothetical protein [Streptosporangium sandarakinum]